MCRVRLVVGQNSVSLDALFKRKDKRTSLQRDGSKKKKEREMGEGIKAIGWRTVAWRAVVLAWQFVMYVPAALVGAVTPANAVAALGPVCVKLAQAATTRPDLFRKDLVEVLRPLQDRVAPEHIPDLPSGATLLASGSIAQVYAYDAVGSDDDDDDNNDDDGEDDKDVDARARLVIKIKRPGVSEQVVADCVILAWLLATRLGRALVSLVCERALVRDAATYLVDAMRDTVERHLDFEAEAVNTKRMAAAFGRQPGAAIVVPRVVCGMCTRDRLVMERIDGVPIADLPSAAARAAAGGLVVRAVCEMALVHGFLHGDVHEGNMLALPAADGEPDTRVRLALLDMGVVHELSKRQRDLVGVLMRAAATRDAHLLASHVYVLCTDRSAPYDGFRDDVAAALDACLHGSDLGALVDGLVAACTRARVPLDKSMVAVLAALIAADGIARRHGAPSLTTIACLFFPLPCGFRRATVTRD